MNADTYVNVLEQATHRTFAFRAQTQSEALSWQREFRSKLKQLLGLDAIEKHGPAPLVSRQLSVETLDDHIREKWELETEPGFFVPFYMLRPLGTDGLTPVVLTPHGHNIRGKEDYAGVYETDDNRHEVENRESDIALQAVREGYIAIAPDMRGFGPLRRQKHIDAAANNSCRDLFVHAVLFGRTVIGERVWDIQRLIDWAVLQPGVNPDAIVVTGNSGGGTVTLFSAAVDERIKVCVPGSYFNTFRDSIASIGHCECNYVPGIMRHAEMYDVAALIAPRPFMAVHGIEDKIYPIEATRDAFEKLQRAYLLFNEEDRCKLSEGSGGHRYYKKDVWKFVSEQINTD